jgi:hypothetical protein
MATLTTTARTLLRSGSRATESARAIPLWLHAAVLSGVALLTFYLARGLWGWTYDDAFIIFRYARNFADGLGMVYNPGEHYLGTSSVGYTLLLAGMHLLLPNLDFLDLASIVSTIGFYMTGALLWLLGVHTRTPLAGALAALFAVVNPVPVEVWGGEMALLVPLVLGTILAYSRGLGTLTGVLLGLAVLTRYDSLVLFAPLAAHYLLTRRKLPLSAIISFVIVVLPWTIYSWIFFGSPLPGTLEAKVAQGKAGWTMFFSGTVQWLNERLGPGLIRPFVFALILAGVIALLLSLRKKPVGPWFMFLAWCALFTVGYTALRVSFYGWYVVPAALGLGTLISWGVAALAEFAAHASTRLLYRLNVSRRKRWPRDLSRALAAGVVLILAFPLADHLRGFSDNYIASHRQSDLYERAGEWLAQHGGPTVSVAYLEVGEIGYVSDSRVVDLLGLVTPGAAAHVPFWDYAWAIQRYRPDYYLANSRFNALLQDVHKEPWFTQAYESVATFSDHPKSDPQSYEMVIYRLKPGAPLPPPVRPVILQRTSQQPLWISSDTPTSHRFGQTFTPPEANISSISLLLGKSNQATTGDLVLHLRRGPTARDDLRRVSVPLSQITNNAWHAFTFEPLSDSAGQPYFFVMELTGTPARQPLIVIWTATDDLYAAGSRYEGNIRVTGDLCFEVTVPDGP